MKAYHTKSIAETMKDLKTSTQGLTDEEAKLRLEKNGENKLFFKVY